MSKSSNNILITGGAGYIGSHVANLLLDNGYDVTIIDNLVTGSKSLVPKKSRFIFLNRSISLTALPTSKFPVGSSAKII